MKKILLVSVLFFYFIQSNGQINYQKLIVAEFRIDSPRVGNFAYIVSYNFENGVLASKDTILGAETFKKLEDGSFSRYVRFEFGGNFIYNNRYAISGTGNVVDIEKKRLVIEEGDDFVSANGDMMIFHRSNSRTGTGYLSLDLKTGNYNFINQEERNKDREQRSSPDNKHYLSIDKGKIPYKIILHSLYNTEEPIVFDAGQGPNITSGGQRPTLETYWINNHSFIYAVHKIGLLDSSRIDTTERFFSKYLSKVTLRKFDIQTKSDSIIMELDNVYQGDVNGLFFKDKIGQTIYRTSGFKYYVLDTIQETLSDYPNYEIGHHFSIKNGYNPDGKIIQYQKKEIGNISAWSAEAAKGIIAVVTSSNEMRIWSDKTKNWLTINIPFISGLVGWIEGE